MCRIFGVVDPSLSAEAASSLGAELARLLHHGGPDSAHVFSQAGLVLGATRLAINDPVGGLQPFRGPGIAVFYNGEIYNAGILRSSLEGRGETLASYCDGEVIPYVLLRDGDQAGHSLNGMYAIAAWHEDTSELMLMRDAAGIKPLYFFADRDRFGFASEIGPLVRIRASAPRVDVAAVDRYLRFKAVYGVESDTGWPTAIEGIVSLPPGATLRVDRTGRPRRLVRSIRSRADGPKSKDMISVDSLTSALDRMADAVTASSVPYCTLLSGGLDSAIVTTLASRRLIGPVATFSAVSERPSVFDESGFARDIVRSIGATQVEVVIPSSRLIDTLPAVVRHLGQPIAEPITFSTYLLFEAIAAAGYKVALTGDGADEVFGGYGRFVAGIETRDADAYRESLAAVPRMVREGLYAPDFVPGAAATAVDDPAFTKAFAEHPLKTMMEFELTHRLPVFHLARVDHLSAAHGVEARVPFCQPEIVEFGKTLSDAGKLGPDGAVKRLLSEAAAADHLAPPSVLARPKQPFTFSLAENFSGDRAVMEWAKDVLLDRDADRGYFRRSAVEELCANAVCSRSESSAVSVWSLLVLELWFQQVLEI